SSEHSICFAIPEAQAVRAEEAVRRAFDAELRDGQIQHVEIGLGMSILAVVGDGMAGSHGVAAKIFNSLGDASISVKAIAQGASERNISVVVEGKVGARALRAVHAAFYLSPNTLSIGLIGPGTVGRVLLAQIATQIDRLRELNLDLRVRGIASSKRMLLQETSVDLRRWAELMAEAGEPLNLEKFINHVQADYVPHTVVIDCTASASIADQYRDWLSRGIHIVTPNKRPTAERFLITAPCRTQNATPALTICMRPPSARGCRSYIRCAICAAPAMRSPKLKASFPEPWRICSMCSTAASLFPPSSAPPRRRAIPNRIRAMTCQASMWPASSL